MSKLNSHSTWRTAEFVRVGQKPEHVWVSAKIKYIEFNRPEGAILAVIGAGDTDMLDKRKAATILISPWEFSHFWQEKARSSEALIVVKDWCEKFIEVNPDSLRLSRALRQTAKRRFNFCSQHQTHRK